MSDVSGKSLERLVAALERAFAGASAEIEAPSRQLVDRDTGLPREFDVLIRWSHGHHRIVTAVECKDHSRPVGVSIVEAFADKCDTAGVHSGVIVSASGFTRSARLKAAARAITCMDWDEVDGFDWLGLEAVVGFKRHFDHVDVQVMFVESRPASIVAITDASGNEFASDDIIQVIINLVPAAENPELEVGFDTPVSMRVNTVDWMARDQDGSLWPIDHILVRTSFTTEKTSHPVRTHRYRGGGKDYAVVSADANFGGTDGTIMIVRDETEQLTVSWSPQARNLAPPGSNDPSN